MKDKTICVEHYEEKTNWIEVGAIIFFGIIIGMLVAREIQII